MNLPKHQNIFEKVCERSIRMVNIYKRPIFYPVHFLFIAYIDHVLSSSNMRNTPIWFGRESSPVPNTRLCFGKTFANKTSLLNFCKYASLLFIVGVFYATQPWTSISCGKEKQMKEKVGQGGFVSPCSKKCVGTRRAGEQTHQPVKTVGLLFVALIGRCVTPRKG